MSRPTFHNVVQGTQGWLALKSRYPFSASVAAAMLGRSVHKTRQELLREIATAGETDIFQPVADEGHRTEEAARPMAEVIAKGELFPVTVTREIDGIVLLASCDGLTMDSSILFEHKQHNAEDAAEVANGSVPVKHQPQLDQGMMVTGATRALFMISDGTEDNCEWCWYEPNPELCTAIVAGWKQFAEDLDNYQHVETVPEPAGATPDALPSLLLDITGAVRDTNLATYQDVVSARIQAINTDLQTDQDFADAEKMVKFLKSGEQEVEAAKAHALAQTQSVDELFRAVDSLKEEMRAKRLELDKLVKARKEAIRAEIVADAMNHMAQHAIEIAEGFDARIRALDVPANFRGEVIAAMKGKKTITSLRDAAAQAVASCKLDMNQEANRINYNVQQFNELMAERDAEHLFPDLSTLARKLDDDFVATVKARVADDIARQEKVREAERVFEEETAKLQAEQAQETVSEPIATVEAQPAPIDEAPTLPAGEICNRLGFVVRVDFLASLGFPATRDKGRMLYRESDWPTICSALISHIHRVRDRHADKAA